MRIYSPFITSALVGIVIYAVGARREFLLALVFLSCVGGALQVSRVRKAEQ